MQQEVLTTSSPLGNKLLMDSTFPAIPSGKCRIESCFNKIMNRRSPFCHLHKGIRTCQTDGCPKVAQGGTLLCISHGGGRRCSFPGCVKGARDRTFCAKHGGGKRCEAVDCLRSAIGGSVHCQTHGGGKNCQAENCEKAAQTPTNYCVKHGGGRICKFKGCSKVSRGKTGVCARHVHMYQQDSVSISSSSHSSSDELNVFSDDSMSEKSVSQNNQQPFPSFAKNHVVSMSTKYERDNEPIIIAHNIIDDNFFHNCSERKIKHNDVLCAIPRYSSYGKSIDETVWFGYSHQSPEQPLKLNKFSSLDSQPQLTIPDFKQHSIPLPKTWKRTLQQQFSSTVHNNNAIISDNFFTIKDEQQHISKKSRTFKQSCDPGFSVKPGVLTTTSNSNNASTFVISPTEKRERDTPPVIMCSADASGVVSGGVSDMDLAKLFLSLSSVQEKL